MRPVQTKYLSRRFASYDSVLRKLSLKLVKTRSVRLRPIMLAASPHDKFSKDPQLAGQLWDSLIRRDIHDFRRTLEQEQCNPNLVDASSGLSVFQTALQTPDSVEFIKLCLEYRANLYVVSNFISDLSQRKLSQ